MTTVKQRVLIGLARRGTVGNAKDLRLDADTDVHNLIHVLHSLRKEGAITFREQTKGAIRIPYSIQLTPQGRQRYEELS